MGVYTNKMRYTGTSGVDVESMVQSLMKAEGAKADKIYKQKTRLEWQQQAIRDLGTNVKSFRNNYLSFSSSTTIMNMRSTKAYLSKSISGTFSGGTAMSNGSTSNILKLGSSSTVSVSADAKAGTYDIDIKSVASKQTNVGEKMTSTAQATTTLDPTKIEAGDYLDITVNGSRKILSFNADELGDIGSDQTKFQKALQGKIDSAFGTIGTQSKVEVGLTGGMISLSSNSTIGSTFSISLDSGVSDATSVTTTGSVFSGVSTDGGATFSEAGKDTYTVNGKSVTVDFGGNAPNAQNITEYMTALNDKLKAENVVASVGSDGNITFQSLNGDGKQTVTSVTRTTTNNVTSQFTMPNTKTLSDVTSSIGADADGKFTTEGTDTYTIGGKTIDIKFGGTDADSALTKTQYLEDLNAELEKLSKDTNGATSLKATMDDTGKITFVDNGTTKTDVKMVRKDTSGTQVGSTYNSVPVATTELTGGASIAKKIGFTETNLSSTFDTSAVMGRPEGTETFKFAGKEVNITITKDMTYKQYMDAVSTATNGNVNMSFNSTSNAFTLSSTVAGSNNKIEFDSNSVFAKEFKISTTAKTEASDASLVIKTPDGIETNIVRETNVISFDGLTFNLDSGLQSTINSSDGGSLKTSITVGSDTTSAYDNIKGFISAYNALLDELTSATKTTRAKTSDYGFYEPLTEEEQEGLSDTQLKKLEDKAKQGILYGNDEIERLTNKMRDIASTSVTLADGTKMSLGSIGISTGDYSSGGKLYITDEEKLKSALEKNAEGVATLFTDSKKGVAEKLYYSVEEAIGSEGYITKSAGAKDSVYVDDNYYSKLIKEKSSDLTRLNDYLTKKENHYYSMFSYMEQSINNANSQMAALGF